MNNETETFELSRSDRLAILGALSLERDHLLQMMLDFPAFKAHAARRLRQYDRVQNIIGFEPEDFQGEVA